MTTILEQMQTGPNRANEIFAKLADTSPTALKTRERMFAELKSEIDRQAEFEDQRLFPVLEKHEETKDLVGRAQEENRRMRELLAEVERDPKDSDAFGRRLAELRDIFQRRLRDDKNEILPAVVKALGEDEAGAGKSEGETAEAAPARRVDEGEHQPEAERRAAAAARQGADIVKAGVDLAQQGALVARRATADAERQDEREQASRFATAAEDARWKERQAETASVGLSMVALLNEQAQHALQVQTVIAARRAQRMAEIAQMQSAFMAASFQRLGKLNDRYLAFARDWKDFVPFPSAQKV